MIHTVIHQMVGHYTVSLYGIVLNESFTPLRGWLLSGSVSFVTCKLLLHTTQFPLLVFDQVVEKLFVVGTFRCRNKWSENG